MVGWLSSSSAFFSTRGREQEHQLEREQEQDEDEEISSPPPGFEVPFAFLDFDPVKEWLLDPPDPILLSPMLPHQQHDPQPQPQQPMPHCDPLAPELAQHYSVSSQEHEATSPIHEKLQKVTLVADVYDGPLQVLGEEGTSPPNPPTQNPDGTSGQSARPGLGSPIDEELEKPCLMSDGDVGHGVSVDPRVTCGEGEVTLSAIIEANVKFDSVKVPDALLDRGDEEESSKSDTKESKSMSNDHPSSSSDQSSTSSNKEEDEGKEGSRMDDDVEVEEGEIRDLDREELAISSDEEEEVARGPIKSRHEIEVLPPVPQVKVSLEPHHRTLPVGFISSILGDRVIVEGSVKHNPLNEGSVLWITVTRSPLGLVDEIFGPVKNPYYIIRYNSDKEVPVGIREGTAISFVMEFANHILNEKNLYKKGYDASGENDEEVGDEVEFSDDEKEAEYRRSQRQVKRGADDKRQQRREFVPDKTRPNFKSAGTQKGMRPHGPPAPTAMAQPLPGVLVSSQAPPTSSSGHSSCSCSLGPGHASNITPPEAPAISQAMQVVGCFSGPSHQMLQQHQDPVCPHVLPPQQQPNAFWPCTLPPQQQLSGVFQHVLPPQQHPVAVWPQGLLMQQQPSAIWTHALPFQQQQDAWMQGLPPQQLLWGLHGEHPNALQSHHLGGPIIDHQHQNQVFNSSMSGASCQQQLIPNLATTNLQWPGYPLNPNFGSMNPGPCGQSSLEQARSGCSNMHKQGASGSHSEQSSTQHSPANVQGAMNPRPQFNMGRSSGRGRKPYMRGGRHSFGRGDRARTG